MTPITAAKKQSYFSLIDLTLISLLVGYQKGIWSVKNLAPSVPKVFFERPVRDQA